jgi:ATP-dependent DNA ligase I
VVPDTLSLRAAMRFHDLVETSASVAGVSGRLEKIGRLAALVEKLEPGEVEIAVAFLSGAIRQGRLGVGHAAIASASDVTPADAPSLTLLEVDRTCQSLATIEGQGSANARVDQLRALFRRATADEQDFLRRLLHGELRQGALAGVLLEAVARAAKVKPAVLRRAAMMAGSLTAVAAAALSGGEAALHAFDVRLMRPVQPMLAESAASVDEALAALGETAFEYKLDGARVQIHKAGDDVRMFSRTLRDVTVAAPEVVDLVRALPARTLILDGEVIALRPDGTPHPFQVTMSRFGRILDVERSRAEVPLTPFLFDCLYLDDTALLDEPQHRRVETLRAVAGPLAVPSIVRPSAEQAQAFTRDALARGHEGVMAKALEAPYAAGRRGAAWLKIKQPRTLDLVVLAAEWGHGRRRGWLSNLHLGARDPETNTFVMLGKTFKGMTDEMLAWQTGKLQTLEIGRDAYTVYVRPELVVEVAFNEIQQSPVYPGGLALRFARIKRYRDDKTAAEADTIETVRRLA